MCTHDGNWRCYSDMEFYLSCFRYGFRIGAASRKGCDEGSLFYFIPPEHCLRFSNLEWKITTHEVCILLSVKINEKLFPQWVVTWDIKMEKLRKTRLLIFVVLFIIIVRNYVYEILYCWHYNNSPSRSRQSISKLKLMNCIHV